MTYYPTVWFNEFWLLRDKMVPLNGSVAEVPLQLSVYPLSLWKFTIYLQMDQSFSMQARHFGLPCSRSPAELCLAFRFKGRARGSVQFELSLGLWLPNFVCVLAP